MGKGGEGTPYENPQICKSQDGGLFCFSHSQRDPMEELFSNQNDLPQDQHSAKLILIHNSNTGSIVDLNKQYFESLEPYTSAKKV